MTESLAGHSFEFGCETVDVTSSSRPDTSWRFVDAQGHEHRWFDGDHPADTYCCDVAYHVPSLVVVIDDGTSQERHHECRQCGEHIEPGMCADTFRMYALGPRWYAIDGVKVSRAEFESARNDASATKK